MSITVVGLGPGQWEQLTIEAKEVLERAEEVYLRTAVRSIISRLPGHLRVHCFDQLFSSLTSPEDVQAAIVQFITELGQRPQGVVYAVPGHPLEGDATVRRVLEEAGHRGLSTRVIPGLSLLDDALTALNLTPLPDGFQIVDALEPYFDLGLPTLITQVHHPHAATLLKTRLQKALPTGHPITLVHWMAEEGKMRTQNLPISELDLHPTGEHWSYLFIPPLKPTQNLTSFAALRHIMAKLRSSEGCPWDREQTHTSIKHNLLEECHEAIEALDEGDMNKLSEELGDLLMHVAFHTQLAEEAGEFTMEDVLKNINAKLLRRHPHVFGNLRAENSREVITHWEAIKRSERAEEASLLSTIPRAMPALSQSYLLQERAARIGFDWSEIAGVLEKLASEVQELAQAPDPERRLEEFGDVLFALVNAGRWLGVDPEEALRLANQRFYRRFRYMEKAWTKQGRSPQDMTLDEMDALWEEAKHQEREGLESPPD